MSLRSATIRLAYEVPELRGHLLPLVRHAAKYDPYEIAMMSPSRAISNFTWGVRGDEAINKDARGHVDGRAALYNRAIEWSEDDFIKNLEFYAAPHKIEELRLDLATKPLEYKIISPKGKVVSRGTATDERDIEKIKANGLSDGGVYPGHTIEVKPRGKADVRKLKELEQAQAERKQAFKALYDDLRTPKLEWRMDRELDLVSVYILDHDVIVGGASATFADYSDDKDPSSGTCWKDIQALAQERGHGPVWTVPTSFLKPHLRGKHLGLELYEKLAYAVKRVGGMYMEPHGCLGSGGSTFGATSQDAHRVWKALARKFPSSGEVIFLQ